MTLRFIQRVLEAVPNRAADVQIRCTNGGSQGSIWDGGQIESWDNQPTLTRIELDFDLNDSRTGREEEMVSFDEVCDPEKEEGRMVYHIAGGIRPAGSTVNPTEPLDGEFSKVRLLDESQDDGRRIRKGTRDNGRAVDGTSMPTRLRRGGDASQPLLDVESANGGMMLVSSVFRDVVEGFEPGVHQFFPVTVEQSGKVIGDRYFFVICNRLDTLHRDLCTPPLEPGQIYQPKHDGNDRKVFDLSRIGNHHAWHDKFTLGTYVTDQVFDALQSAGVSGLGFKKYDQA